MSYIRPLEQNLGLYIYPEDNGVRFMCFPQHNGELIFDEMLDILLSKISSEELYERRHHGAFLLNALSNGDFDSYKKNKGYFKYKEDKRNGRL